LRINEQIRISAVRLIDENGAQVGVVETAEALKRAEEAGLDLVEVSPDGEPPVCRIMDYGKFKYKQKKKVHQSKTKQHVTQIKELRLHPKTDKHDIEIKIAHARGFLAKKDKVMVNMLFKGREMAHIEIAKEKMAFFAQQLEDVGKLERPPLMEGRRMHMVLAPK
jgi:translation initiation factor IF-3